MNAMKEIHCISKEPDRCVITWRATKDAYTHTLISACAYRNISAQGLDDLQQVDTAILAEILAQVIWSDVYNYCVAEVTMPLAIENISLTHIQIRDCLAGKELQYQLLVYTSSGVVLPEGASWYRDIVSEEVPAREELFHIFVEAAVFPETPEVVYGVLYKQHVDQIVHSFNTMLATHGISFAEYCIKQGTTAEDEQMQLFAAAHHATRVDCVSYAIAMQEGYTYDPQQEALSIQQIGDTVVHSLNIHNLPSELTQAMITYHARKTMQQQFAMEWVQKQISCQTN